VEARWRRNGGEDEGDLGIGKLKGKHFRAKSL